MEKLISLIESLEKRVNELESTVERLIELMKKMSGIKVEEPKKKKNNLVEEK